jgi:[ribosomal protein S5]-alanine N-acetyltransferase
VRLETERLVLRPLSLDDLDRLAEFYADAEVMRYIGPGKAIDRDRSRQSLERMIGNFEAEGFGQLGVDRKDDGAFMGRCGLLVWDTATWSPTRVLDVKGAVEVEVGYLLGREYWGHGYATEAATAVRDWALANLDLKRLIALIYPENTQSIAVARKLGMKPDGEVEIFGSRVTRYAFGKRPAR